jgi:hypothetical protein
MATPFAGNTTAMDPGPQFVIQTSFNDALKNAVGRIETEDQHSDLTPYKAGNDPRRWNIELNSLVGMIKPECAHSMSVLYDVGNNRTYGKTPIVATVAGIPAAMDPETEVLTGTGEKKEDVLRQAVLDQFSFVGVSKGYYDDREGESKSPLQEGLPVNPMGAATISVHIDGDEPPPMCDVQLWLPNVRSTGRGMGAASNTLERRFTIKQFTAKTIEQQTLSCVELYLRSLRDNRNNWSFFDLREKAASKNVMLSHDIRQGHMHVAGVLAMALQLNVLLKTVKPTTDTAGKLVLDLKETDESRKEAQELATKFGISSTKITEEGLLYLEALFNVNKTTKVHRGGHAYYTNMVENASAHIAQSVAEICTRKNKIIGRMLRVARSGGYSSGGVKHLDVFFHL